MVRSEGELVDKGREGGCKEDNDQAGAPSRSHAGNASGMDAGSV
jgi:hypothetical protein